MRCSPRGRLTCGAVLPSHCSRPQPTRSIPILGLIARNQVLVRDDVRARQLLRHAHDHIARFSQCGVDREVAEHAGDQAMTGVAHAKDFFGAVPDERGVSCSVYGFRATAACKFVSLKRALGYSEAEARHELAMWLGHHPHRTEVTYAYVPRCRTYEDQPSPSVAASRHSACGVGV